MSQFVVEALHRQDKTRHGAGFSILLVRETFRRGEENQLAGSSQLVTVLSACDLVSGWAGRVRACHFRQRTTRGKRKSLLYAPSLPSASGASPIRSSTEASYTCNICLSRSGTRAEAVWSVSVAEGSPEHEHEILPSCALALVSRSTPVRSDAAKGKILSHIVANSVNGSPGHFGPAPAKGADAFAQGTVC